MKKSMAFALRVLVVPTLCLLAPAAFAAKIISFDGKSVVVEFDPIQENFVAGERVAAMQDGKRKATIQITQLNGPRFAGRVLRGKAEIGMETKKINLVLAKKATAPSAKAEPPPTTIPTVTIVISSLNVWRGVAVGDNRPLLLGAVNFANEGLIAGFFFLNSGLPAKGEADFYLGYQFNQIDWSLAALVTRYSFTGAPQFDSWEGALRITILAVGLEYSFFPDFFGSKSGNHYAKLSSAYGIGEKWKILGHVGYSKPDKEDLIGHKAYIDYKLGFLYSVPEFNVEFAYTDTTRNNLAGDKIIDAATTVTISKTF